VPVDRIATLMSTDLQPTDVTLGDHISNAAAFADAFWAYYQEVSQLWNLQRGDVRFVDRWDVFTHDGVQSCQQRFACFADRGCRSTRFTNLAANAWLHSTTRSADRARRAQQHLGQHFSLSQFHDVVLGQGMCTLPELARRIESWQSSRLAVTPPDLGFGEAQPEKTSLLPATPTEHPMSLTSRMSHLPQQLALAVILAVTATGCAGSTNNVTTPTPATTSKSGPGTLSSAVAVSSLTGSFTAGALAATLTPDQISSAHAIAAASMFSSDVLGPEWSLVPQNPDTWASPPPLCERFKASVYDRSLDPISDYRVFSAPNRINATIWSTVYPTEAVATRYFDEMLRPDYMSCVLQFVDVTMVTAPLRSTSVIGPTLALRPRGDRVFAYQTSSTITSGPAPILGALNQASVTAPQRPVILDSVVIQIGRAIVEVDLAPDNLAPDDPAGIVDRALSALVSATKTALAKT
jgi:hypothetical protein